LTTVGLPARKEQLLRSMLIVANAHTTDQWQFSDDLESDVAICDAHSLLSGVALARSKREGRPACVWLTVGDEGAPDGRRLQDPIVTVRLIAMLDALSSALPAPRQDAAPPAPAGTIVGSASSEPARRYDALLLIRDLLDRGTVDPFRLSVGSIEIHVLPGTGTICMAKPLSKETVDRLLDPGPAPRLEPMTNGQGMMAGYGMPIDAVLWAAGLAGGLEEPLPTLPPLGRFSLKRWPDFGKLTHDPSHVQMAALLVRRPYSLADLAQVARKSEAEARAFVTACALCGLVTATIAPAEAEPAAAPVAAPVAPEPEPQPVMQAVAARRGIFTSIRAALGMGRR
jgi:hypothetical protein